MEFTFLQNRLVVAVFPVVVGAVVGAILTLLIQRIANKSSLFTFFVSHYRVGVSADDAAFGSVRATWNDRPVANLWSSSIELQNESLKDYENVTIRVFTTDTVLLTERTEIVGTILSLEWTADFVRRFTVQPGSQPTPEQRIIHESEREYFIPTMNRGQSVRLTYLNTAKTEQQPNIWLDILHKGVKAKFRIPPQEVFPGVPRDSAVMLGSALGIVSVALVLTTVETLWFAAVLSFLCGWLVVLPGAASIKLWRKLRDWLGG